jgi:hypothetical protein
MSGIRAPAKGPISAACVASTGHCKGKHLHRYLSEFDFRYSNCVAPGIDDVSRADRALKGIVGKRLTYRATRELEAPNGKSRRKAKANAKG